MCIEIFLYSIIAEENWRGSASPTPPPDQLTLFHPGETESDHPFLQVILNFHYAASLLLG